MGLICILAISRGVCANEFADVVSITDARGETEKFYSPPKRIICLYGALNELLLALGCSESIVARTRADKDVEGLARLPSIGTHMRPNLELIMAQNPDLVIQLKGRNEALDYLEPFRKLGVKTLVFEIESFMDLFYVTEKLGTLMGKENEAEKLIGNWKKRLEAMTRKNPGPRPRVFYEARYPNLLAAGSMGIINDIIEMAGGRNVVDVPKKLARINEEYLFLKDPDIYIMQKGPMNPASSPPAERPGFRELRASRNVLIVDERKFARPGPYSVDAAETLHNWLFPDDKQKVESQELK